MFFAVTMGSPDADSRARQALGIHSDALVSTNLAGPLQTRSFPGVDVWWDGASSHVFIDDDPDLGTWTLLAGYLAAGVRPSQATQESGGEFAIIRLNSRGSVTTLEVFADLAGSWPLYYGTSAHQAVISNDPHAVAAAQLWHRLDAQGAIELLSYGHTLGDRTTIRGVRRCPHGQILKGHSSHEAPPELAPEPGSSYAYSNAKEETGALAGAAFAALQRDVGRMPPITEGDRPVIMQVSGGLDSRLTAAVSAPFLRRTAVAVTLDLSDSHEVEIAAEVSQRLGLPHRIAGLAASAADVRSAWTLTGGQVSAFAATGNLVAYAAGGLPLDGPLLVVGGWPGDCLIGSYVPLSASMLSENRVEATLRRWAALRGRSPQDLGVAVGDAAAGRAIWSDAKQSLLTQLLHASGSTAAQKISHWAMFGRQPAFSYVSPARLTSHVLEATPLLGRGYLEVLMKLSAQQLVAKNFYRRLLVDHVAELTSVAYAATGRPIDADPLTPSVRWGVRDVVQAAPAGVERRLRRLGRLVRDSRRPLSTEETFWNSVKDLQSRERLRLDDVALEIKSTAAPTHTRGVILSLTWTSEYLQQVRSRVVQQRL